MPSENVDIVLDISGADRVTRDAEAAGRAVEGLGDAADAAGTKGSRMGRMFAGARRGLGAAAGAAGRAAVGIAKFGAAAGAAAIFAGAKFIGLASDAGEIASAFEVTFGKGAAAVNRFVEDTAALSGSATAAIQEAVNVFGSFAKAAGIADDQVGGFATGLVGAANDIASFKNADPTQVMADMQSALSGSIEPMRKYGIFMSDAALSAQAAEMGLGDTFSALAEGEKVMVRQAFIMANLGDAAGDLARTAESPANTFRFLAGRSKEAATMLGSGLMPAVTALTPTMRDLADKGIAFITDHLPALEEWSGRVGERLAAMINDDLPIWWDTLTGAVQAFRDGGISEVGRLVDTAVGGDGRFATMLDRLGDGFDVARNLAGRAGEMIGGFVDQLRGIGGSGAAGQLDSFASALTGPFAVGLEAAQAALPVVTAAFEWLEANAATIGPAVAAIAAGMVAMRAGGTAVNSALAPIGGLRGAIASTQLATAGLNLTTQILARTTNVSTAATNTNTAATLRQRAGTIAATAAKTAANAATKAWAAGQWLLNAALTANPIGLVIAAVVGLGAAVVVAWNRSERFREIVTDAFEKVREAATAAWEWIKTNWKTLKDALTAPFRAASGLIDGVWDGIKGSAANAVNWVIERINGIIRAANSAIDGLNRLNPFGDIPTIAELPKVQPRVDGGPVAAGRPYLVGEHGPELAVFDRTGTIIPNRHLGGVVVNVGDVTIAMDRRPGESAERVGRRAGRAFLDEIGRAAEERYAWA